MYLLYLVSLSLKKGKPFKLISIWLTKAKQQRNEQI